MYACTRMHKHTHTHMHTHSYIHTYTHIQEAVDIFGLSAIDRLFCFMIVRELQAFLRYLQRSLMKTPVYRKHLHDFVTALGDTERLMRMLQWCHYYIMHKTIWVCLLMINTTSLKVYLFCTCVASASKFYSQYVNSCAKVWGPFLDCVMKVPFVVCLCCEHGYDQECILIRHPFQAVHFYKVVLSLTIGWSDTVDQTADSKWAEPLLQVWFKTSCKLPTDTQHVTL